MYRNGGHEMLVFRDDAGKHRVEPGTTFDVAGDQHLPYVMSLPGVEQAPAKRAKHANADDEPK